ncbi:MAG: hypothetical protein QNK37_37330 [Acidobacteriota bacterium]|nr:hypothetical protein [Acidobacteriota bacterium]
MVLIRGSEPEGIFRPETFELVRRLTDTLIALPGLRPQDVTSLANEYHYHHRKSSLDFQTLLERERTTPEEIAVFRRELASIQLYTGTLVSSDGMGTAIYVAPPGDDHGALYAKVRRAIEPFDDGPENGFGSPISPRRAFAGASTT